MKYLTLIYVAALVVGLTLSPAQAAVDDQAANKVVGVVNGEMITSFDLEQAATPELMQSRIDPRNPANADKVQTILRKTLETMITDIVVVQEATRLKVSASDADINSELKQVVDRSKLSEEEFFSQLARQGMTKEQVQDRLRKRILQQRLMASMVGRKVIVSKDEVAKYFASHGNSIQLDGKVSFAVLVYHPKANASDWAARIRSGKISFEDAVKQVSIGPRRDQGGHLDMMSSNEVMPNLRPRLESLKSGQVSEIFQMDGFSTQLKLIEVVEGKRLQTLEEALPVIEEKLRAPKLEERYQEYLAQLRKKALVEIRL